MDFNKIKIFRNNKELSSKKKKKKKQQQQTLNKQTNKKKTQTKTKKNKKQKNKQQSVMFIDICFYKFYAKKVIIAKLCIVSEIPIIIIRQTHFHIISIRLWYHSIL
jgi:hypothetical protein